MDEVQPREGWETPRMVVIRREISLELLIYKGFLLLFLQSFLNLCHKYLISTCLHPVQFSLSVVSDSATPGTVAHQDSLSITNS